MKKITFILLGCLLMLSDSQAQSSNVRLTVAYGFPLASSATSSTYVNYGATGYNELAYGSLAEGVLIGAGYTYRLTKFIGVDFEFQYLMGKTFTSTSLTYSGFGFFQSTMKNSAQSLFVTPSILVFIPIKKLEGYLKIGPYIGFPKTSSTYSFDDYDVSQPSTPLSHEQRRFEYNYDIAIGLKSGIGIIYPITSRWNALTELNFSALSMYVNTSEFTEYISNGVDRLPSLSVRDKKTIYKTKITSPGSLDPSQPSEALKYSTPFSSWSVQIGISFKVSK